MLHMLVHGRVGSLSFPPFFPSRRHFRSISRGRYQTRVTAKRASSNGDSRGRNDNTFNGTDERRSRQRCLSFRNAQKPEKTEKLGGKRRRTGEGSGRREKEREEAANGTTESYGCDASRSRRYKLGTTGVGRFGNGL